MARVLVGTSGWHYDSWRGPFFPKGLPLKQQLPFYASRFQTTELNSVFYRTPTPLAVKAWRDQTSEDFVFAWKASKFITHWKRLSSKANTSLELLESRIALLGDKAGPILFQLPPNFQADPVKLAAFFKMLPKHHRYSFEFRHPSWYTSKVFSLLSAHNVSLCISDHSDAPAPWTRTADFVYVRGHGPTGRYKDNYSPATLAAWSKRIRSWKKSADGTSTFISTTTKKAPRRLTHSGCNALRGSDERVRLHQRMLS